MGCGLGDVKGFPGSGVGLARQREHAGQEAVECAIAWRESWLRGTHGEPAQPCPLWVMGRISEGTVSALHRFWNSPAQAPA